MVLVICEGGWFASQALARSGSCNRSLYAVCAKLLGPAVENKRIRLYGQIKRTVEAQLMENAHVDLDRMRQDRRYYFARHFAQPLRLGVRVIEFQIRDSALRKDNWLFNLRLWGGKGPRELQKYSSETIRGWLQRTEYYVRMETGVARQFRRR